MERKSPINPAFIEQMYSALEWVKDELVPNNPMAVERIEKLLVEATKPFTAPEPQVVVKEIVRERPPSSVLNKVKAEMKEFADDFAQIEKEAQGE